MLVARHDDDDDDEIVLFCCGTLTDITTPSQSGPGINWNERVLLIHQSTGIGSASSGGLVLYPGNCLVRGSYNSTEEQSTYSIHQDSMAMILHVFTTCHQNFNK